MADRDANPEGSSPEEQLRRVAACWDRAAETRRGSPLRGWLDSHVLAAERLNAPVSGSPSVNWLVGLVERLRIPPSSRWLSVGCGAAGQEVGAAQQGLFAHLDAIDISRSALEEARRIAAAAAVENISFVEIDFSRYELPPESYDVVFMNMSLHHVKELDAFLARIAACLRPDGFFLINEYIGPRQFQFGERQLSIVNDLLEALPEKLRHDVTTGEIKRAYERKSVEYWNVADPSEAVRSDLIVPTLDRRFDVVERIDYGGTVLHLLLEHIIHNFDNGNDAHVAILRLLARFEDVLISRGVLPSDFTVMALARKEAPAAGGAPVPEPEPAGVDPEIQLLRAELTKAYTYIRKLEDLSRLAPAREHPRLLRQELAAGIGGLPGRNEWVNSGQDRAVTIGSLQRHARSMP